MDRTDEDRAAVPDSMTEALKAFGWEVGPAFAQRYRTDPWVFNLANAVERLACETTRLREENERLRERGHDALRLDCWCGKGTKR